MSAGLAASTVTPGSAPPVASLTTPAIALCADARPPMSASADTTSTAVINLRIYVPLSFIDVSRCCRWLLLIGRGGRTSGRLPLRLQRPPHDITWPGTLRIVFAPAIARRSVPGLAGFGASGWHDLRRECR